jgi:iron complex outermembrane receptor protein
MRLLLAASICILLPITLCAQNIGIVKGKVSTTDDKAIAFVNVSIPALKKGVITSEDGTYLIQGVPAGEYVLRISHVGIKTQEQQIKVIADTALPVNVVMSEKASQLEEVVVNAQKGINHKIVAVGKIGVPVMDLPQGIAIVDEQVIKDQQAMRLSDVIKNINGVYLATERGSTQENFSARGYAFSSTNMFKNGARVNSGAMPEVSGLERVEVLKGSAAILYGNVSPGGILNMVTKQPKFYKGGEISMRVGSYGLYKPAFDIYGPVNARLAYRLNGTYEKANSYRDVVHSDRYYINPSLLYKVSDKTEIVLEGDYLYHKFTPDFGIGSIDNNKIPDVSRSTFFGTSWQYAKTQQTTATASIRHHFNENWSLNGSASYQQYSRDYYSTERIQFKANGDWARPLNKTKAVEDYYAAQVNLSGKFNTGKIAHTLLVGADADRYLNKTYTYVQPTIYDTLNLFDPNKFVQRTGIPAYRDSSLASIPTNRFGAYVQDLISISEKVKVLAGIRWSFQEAQPTTTTYYTKKDSIGVGMPKTDKAFSPRVGLVYKPINTMAVFASYANSFTPNTGTDIYNNALKPSIIDQFELGIKNDFFKGALSANVTAYRIVNNNFTQMALFKADGTENTNTSVKESTDQQTTSDGIEVDLSGHPVKGLDIIGGYSYNNMRYTKNENKKGNYVVGQRLVNTPAHTANLTAFYTFSDRRLKDLKVGAGAYYIGKRIGGWNNTIGQSYTYDRQIPVDGFITVDLNAGYTYKHFAVLAKVSNITNTYSYYVHENYSINPIPPTQLSVTVSYRL